MNYRNNPTGFVIERGVPVPAAASGRPRKYPFAEMRKGDSFLVAFNDETPAKLRALLATAANMWARKSGGKFTVRTLDTGVRVWRVE
jgi:hypothetical protein